MPDSNHLAFRLLVITPIIRDERARTRRFEHKLQAIPDTSARRQETGGIVSHGISESSSLSFSTDTFPSFRTARSVGGQPAILFLLFPIRATRLGGIYAAVVSISLEKFIVEHAGPPTV